MMVIALLAVVTVSAQRHGGRGLKKDLSTEELATLRTKKMTLDLALDKKQSDKVYKLVLEEAKERKTQMAARKSKNGEDRPELTKEQKFERANTRLDKRIAMQNEMKAILTDAQFRQYREMMGKKQKKGGKRGHKKERRARK